MLFALILLRNTLTHFVICTCLYKETAAAIEKESKAAAAAADNEAKAGAYTRPLLSST